MRQDHVVGQSIAVHNIDAPRETQTKGRVYVRLPEECELSKKAHILDQEMLFPAALCFAIFIIYLCFCHFFDAGENWYIVGVCVFAAALYLTTYNKIFFSRFGSVEDEDFKRTLDEERAKADVSVNASEEK